MSEPASGAYYEPATAAAEPPTKRLYHKPQAQDFGQNAAMVNNMQQESRGISLYHLTKPFHMPRSVRNTSGQPVAPWYTSYGTTALIPMPTVQTQLPNPSTNTPSAVSLSQPSQTQDIPLERVDNGLSPLEQSWKSYQSTLHKTNQSIMSDALEEASESLLEISKWLLTNVTDLGLNIDDCNLHVDRVKLWSDFNHAWLALLQRQKDMMESTPQLSLLQGLILRDRLRRMGTDLVGLCNGIEEHGLVDYQCGVWEEEIIAILEECLDLYDKVDEVAKQLAGGLSSEIRHP